MSIDLFKCEYVPTGEPIKKIEHGIIYFVHNGRNAWHSTWVQKYYPGCMHSTPEEAIEYCEEKRTNGSVFYIIETPAIIICFNYGKLIATQINTSSPLESYSPPWLMDSSRHTKQEENRTPSTIEEITASLNIESIHWNKPQQNNQPVILLWLFDHDASIAPITESPLATYRSASHGTKYYLSWSKLEKSISPARVIEIAEFFEPEHKKGKVKSISNSRITKHSTPSCPHEQAVKYRAYSICGRLTKAYGTAVYLQEISLLDNNKFQIKLGVKLSRKIMDIFYTVITDGEAKITCVEHIKNSSIF